jgi:pimeloyl-ACP methyl ester carboxylesterase
MSEYRDYCVPTQEIGMQVRDYNQPADAVIFLHFSGANLMMWQRVISAFTPHYRAVLVDLRDHGKTDKPQARNDIDQMAYDVAGMLDYLSLDRVHIVGSSMGAEVGASLAANYPERVKSLVCDGALYSEQGPYGIWTDSEAAFKKHVDKQLKAVSERPVEVFPTFYAFVQARKKTLMECGAWNEAIEKMVEYDAHKLQDGTFTRSHQRQAAVNYMRSYYNCHFENYYRLVKCPVLMVTSDEAPDNPREKSATLKMSKLPANGRLVTLPGWNHPYGWLLDPDAMVRVVLEFLGAQAI